MKVHMYQPHPVDQLNKREKVISLPEPPMMQGLLPNGDIPPNVLHGRISGNDVTSIRKNMGIVPHGLPAIGSKVKVTGKSTWITIKVKAPHPTKQKKTIWVDQTVLSHWRFTSFGHMFPVNVQNVETMQDGVTYDAIVTRVSSITSLVPTLTVAVIY